MKTPSSPPAFWIAACAALALASVAVFNPPDRAMVRDLPLPERAVDL